MPGVHVIGLGEWLAERDELPERPRAPVEAALRAAGARIERPLLADSDGWLRSWAV